LRLTEQARRRIPGTVLASEQPAPIGNERQQDPDRLRQRAGEVGDRGVNRDHEIEALDCRGGVGKIRKFVAGDGHARPIMQCAAVGIADVAG
jgi:hypothetical protein